MKFKFQIIIDHLNKKKILEVQKEKENQIKHENQVVQMKECFKLNKNL